MFSGSKKTDFSINTHIHTHTTLPTHTDITLQSDIRINQHIKSNNISHDEQDRNVNYMETNTHTQNNNPGTGLPQIT